MFQKTRYFISLELSGAKYYKHTQVTLAHWLMTRLPDTGLGPRPYPPSTSGENQDHYGYFFHLL